MALPGIRGLGPAHDDLVLDGRTRRDRPGRRHGHGRRGHAWPGRSGVRPRGRPGALDSTPARTTAGVRQPGAEDVRLGEPHPSPHRLTEASEGARGRSDVRLRGDPLRHPPSAPTHESRPRGSPLACRRPRGERVGRRRVRAAAGSGCSPRSSSLCVRHSTPVTVAETGSERLQRLRRRPCQCREISLRQLRAADHHGTPVQGAGDQIQGQLVVEARAEAPRAVPPP